MLYFNIIVLIIALLFTYFSSSWVFEHVLSASGDILKDATAYFNIRVFGFPLSIITFSLFGVFRGIQNTWWAMVAAIIGGSINVLLDFVLVFGWWGLPAMGVEGAALASVIAQLVMLSITLYFFSFNRK